MINYDRRYIEELKKQLPKKPKKTQNYFFEKFTILAILFIIIAGVIWLFFI